MKRRGAIILGVAGAVTMAAALGYELIGPKWDGRRIVMELQLGDSSGVLIDGSADWNASAENALAIWNQYIKQVQFFVVRDSTAPFGDGNGYNNVFFSDTVYGFDFDDAVAITTLHRERGIRTEADVIFNNAYSWNSYRGPLMRAAGGGTLYDIRRVAIHEFGHVLGLDHPDEAGQSVVAIMNSHVSDIDTVQDDDIAGAQALYGKRGGGESPLGQFTKPGKRSVTTSRSRLVFRGTADSSQVKKVYLRNFNRYYRVKGVDRWRRSLPLRTGVNRVTLYVDTGSGERQKIDRVRVNRR